MDERKTNLELQMAFSYTLWTFARGLFSAIQHAKCTARRNAVTSSDLSNHAGHRNFLIDLSSELVRKKKTSHPYSETLPVMEIPLCNFLTLW